jgi:Transposase DDE domain group 1
MDPSLTSVAGLVMFGVFLRGLGVDRALREAFALLKSRDAIYPMAAQLRMLLDLFIVGEQRVFGLESLAADPLFVHLAGGVVPSLDTVYRDLARFDEPSLGRLEAMAAEHGLALLRRSSKWGVVHLDIDTTVTPVFGAEIEGALPGPNPKYHGRPSFHPVLARVAETDSCVGALLRPGDTAFGAAEVPLVERWIDRTRAAVGPNCLMYVRIDGAGDCADIMSAIAQRGAFFLTKAKMTPDLCGVIAHHKRWRTVDCDANMRPTRQVATIDFARDEWKKRGLAVRVIVVRSRERESGKHIYLWNDLDYTAQVFLTNDVYSDEDDLAYRYDKRAGIEPLIGEWKGAWGIGKVSSDNFDANHAALLLKLLAHNLLRRYVHEHLPALRSWRAPWIRRAAILVPGRLLRSGRRRSLRMAPRPMLN